MKESLPMVGESRLKVHLEGEGFREVFEGTADEVMKAMIAFLTRVYPTFDIAQRLTFAPDITQLSEKLTGIAQVAPEGLILLAGRELPAEEAVCITLLGAYVVNRLGKLGRESMSSSELSKTTGKALKTIVNQLALLVDDGMVERVGRGEYRITSMGIRHAEEILQRLKAGKETT